MVVEPGALWPALAILVVTLILVVWQPRGLGIGWSALAGAGVALAVGVVSWADVGVVWHIVWDATFTFVALIVISVILDEAGFFAWADLHVGRWGGGRGQVLFPLGMYAVVYGLGNAGLTGLAAGVLEWLAAQGVLVATVGTGFLAAALASLMNNLPSTLVSALVTSPCNAAPTSTNPATSPSRSLWSRAANGRAARAWPSHAVVDRGQAPCARRP